MDVAYTAWANCSTVGIRGLHSAHRRQTLLDQNCPATLIELDRSGTYAEVIRPIIDYAPAVESCRSLIGTMAVRRPVG